MRRLLTDLILEEGSDELWDVPWMLYNALEPYVWDVEEPG